MAYLRKNWSHVKNIQPIIMISDRNLETMTIHVSRNVTIYDHIILDIGEIKRYVIGPFWPDPGAKRHILCHFAPSGIFHCINVVQSVLWLIRLTNLRLAKIVPVNNNDSAKSKNSKHFGQWIKTLKIYPMDYSRLFSLKHAMSYSMSKSNFDF